MGNTQPYNAQPYSRDRTQEFQSIVETLKNSSSSWSSSPLPVQFEFDKRVSKISLGIRQTFQKLAKLAKVSKRRSVFDDTTREIQVLSEVIKQDITALNSDVLDLQRLCNTQNGSWNVSTAASRNYTEVIANLKNRLRNLTRDFIDLTMRTEKRKADETRRQLYRPHASTELTNPFVRQSPLATKSAASESPAPPPRVNGASSSSTQFPRKQTDEESQALLQQPRQQQLFASFFCGYFLGKRICLKRLRFYGTLLLNAVNITLISSHNNLKNLDKSLIHLSDI
ncbi:syntaxin-32-like [Silene latifolia]|uniref:syntaxin-32-like n=1 Tax=Silene latifolia TaxID=37657 RepID=UPI003D789292